MKNEWPAIIILKNASKYSVFPFVSIYIDNIEEDDGYKYTLIEDEGTHLLTVI